LIDFAKVEKTVERWNSETVKRWNGGSAPSRLRGEKSNLCLICANLRFIDLRKSARNLNKENYQ